MKTKIVLITIVCVLLSLGIGIFAGAKLFPTKLVCAPCPKNATPPVVSSSSDLQNWKTYKNEKYGFEFKYPEDLINAQEDLQKSIHGNDYYSIEFFTSNDFQITTDQLSSYASKGFRYTLNLLKEKCSDLEKTGQSKIGYKNYTKSIFNSFQSQQYEVVWDGAKNNRSIDIDYPYGCLQFKVDYGDINLGPKQFDQILSTFKFIEK